MALPENICSIIWEEISYTWDKDEFNNLNRRKGGTDQYDLLPKNRWDSLLQAWNNFHKDIAYNSFKTFYSKDHFCSQLRRDHFPEDLEKARELFLFLLADREFLFLEYSEHLNAPNYPPLSEIVRTPRQYLASQNTASKDSAELVLQHGFVPTYAHNSAYDQMRQNFEDLNQAIRRREQCRTKDQELHQPLKQLCQIVQIHIEPFDENPSELEENLGHLFQQYLELAAENAYTPSYYELSKLPRSNYLPVIHAVMEYLDSQNLQSYNALVLFHLFTQRTKKLAHGHLKDYKFKELRHLAAKGPPQEITRRRTEHKIMLFDYLLQLLSPNDIDYIKYLFFQYTMYNGYYHFNVSLGQDKELFSCLPNHNDSVDQLGGDFRRHIRFCIPNDVSWLIPDLPNNREVNSKVLATLLLQDAEYLPVYTRLTDRIRRLLKDPVIANEMIDKYQDAYLDQKKTLQLLKGWCFQYGLEFIGAEGFLDLRMQRSETLRQMCGRFVLEYMLRERIYGEARKNLSQVAQTLFGELCLEGEVFQLS